MNLHPRGPEPNGYVMSFVRKKKKLFYCGTITLLLLAVTCYSIFNMLVQSESLKYFGFFLPAVTYIPIVIAQIRSAKKKAKANIE